jgi:uncharacterized protein (DUF4415 family)
MKGKRGKIEEEFRFRPARSRPVPREQRHDAAPGDTELRNCQVGVYLKLDADIVEYFKTRARQPHAASYQTQINNALRSFMEREPSVSEFSGLIENEEFLNAVAERLAHQPSRFKRSPADLKRKAS